MPPLPPDLPNVHDIWDVLPRGQNQTFSPSGKGKKFTYTYNSSGQKASEVNLNRVLTNYTYGGPTDATTTSGPVGNLTQVVQDAGAGNLNRTTTMSYDIAGHVTASTDLLGQASSFQYNTLGQPHSGHHRITRRRDHSLRL